MYVAAGVEVLVVTCTGGERGDVLNPRLKDDPEIAANIHAIRAAEMEAAREILGVQQAWLGFVDSGLPSGDPLPPLPEDCFALVPAEEAAAPLVQLIREFRPHVMTTYDEEGGYPHPDHIATPQGLGRRLRGRGRPGAVPGPRRAVAAAEALLRRHLHQGEDARPARGDARERARVALRASGWSAGRTASRPHRDARACPCAEYFPVRDAALLAHATQVDPDGFFFKMPMELQQATWPTEDFELARSLVDTDLPEDDLFAGVRDRVCP